MIHKQLLKIRAAKGWSQEQMAEVLGVSRPTYADIEKGKGELAVSGLEQLAKSIGVPASSLFAENDLHVEVASSRAVEKYKNMLLYALHCGADAKDGKITKTKLAKLLYLADFAWYYKYLEPMSGLAYRRLGYGPVPDQYFRAIDELAQNEHQINITTSTKGALMISATENVPPTYHLSKKEMALIADICKKWKGRNTQDIVDFTHNQLPWKLCRPDELIPYELIIQEDPVHVY